MKPARSSYGMSGWVLTGINTSCTDKLQVTALALPAAQAESGAH